MKYRHIFTGYLFPSKLVEIIFVISIIPSHVITESPILVSIDLPFSQVHVLEIEILFFSCTRYFLRYLHRHLFQFWFELHLISLNFHLHLHDASSPSNHRWIVMQSLIIFIRVVLVIHGLSFKDIDIAKLETLTILA